MLCAEFRTPVGETDSPHSNCEDLVSYGVKFIERVNPLFIFAENDRFLLPHKLSLLLRTFWRIGKAIPIFAFLLRAVELNKTPRLRLSI